MPKAFRKFCLFVLAMSGALFLYPASAQQSAPSPGGTPESWVKFGIDRGVAGDLDGAISAFDEAIKLDPKFAPAYQNRGHARSLQNKLDEAIADYTLAIQFDPKYQDAYYDRAVARSEKGDFEGALPDFNTTLELNPQHSSAFYNRGHVKYFLGDLPGATSDLNQSIALAPNPPFSYFIRGLARLANSDREGAAADFRQSATNGYADAALWLWIVNMQTGERGIARSNLGDFLSKPQLFKPDGWPIQIGNYFLGKSTQDQLVAAAKADAANPEKLCEAWFYSGVVDHFNGDDKGALDCYQKAIATEAKVSEIYIEAQREATKLQKP